MDFWCFSITKMFIPNLVTSKLHQTLVIYTLWLFNIAMENGPFIDDFPIETSIYEGLSMAMLNNQMVYIIIYIYNYLGKL